MLPAMDRSPPIIDLVGLGAGCICSSSDTTIDRRFHAIATMTYPEHP
jgi:hypothetical protein